MTDPKDLIIGNWKMNASHLDAIQMLQKLYYRLEKDDYQKVEVVVAPPFTALRSAQTVIEADRMPFGLAAQNVYWEEKGAYTGEVSPPMLERLGVRYVIVGHSERRQYFGETDEMVNKRARAVIGAGMTPVICVGESLDQREAGEAESVVVSQLQGALARIGVDQVGQVVVAYEPVWAIGTGRTALPEDAGKMAEIIRKALTDQSNSDASASVRILYGGSVNPANVADIMAKRHVNGALVGGASLDPDQFAAIVRYRL